MTAGRLVAIGTAAPAASFDQEFALAEIRRLVGDTEAKRSFLTRIYRASGIRKRHSVVEDYGKDPADHRFHPKSADLRPEVDTKRRNDFYVEHASPLAAAAVADLARTAAFDPARVTHLVTVSCTGFSAPGWDFDLAVGLPLRPDVERFHVAFMGCFGAFPALRLARSITLADPAARVLVVCLELCSVHFQLRWDPELQVANALFADGAAAALVVGADAAEWDGPALRLDGFTSRIAPASRDAMAWAIGEHGFDMRLSSYVPGILQSGLRDYLTPLLRGEKDFADVPHWALHPGGRAILDKAAVALGLERGRLRWSDDVLAEYGNMSSATVLFVLRRALEEAAPGAVLSAAFGPGLTVEAARFEKIDG